MIFHTFLLSFVHATQIFSIHLFPKERLRQPAFSLHVSRCLKNVIDLILINVTPKYYISIIVTKHQIQVYFFGNTPQSYIPLPHPNRFFKILFNFFSNPFDIFRPACFNTITRQEDKGSFWVFISTLQRDNSRDLLLSRHFANFCPISCT